MFIHLMLAFIGAIGIYSVYISIGWKPKSDYAAQIEELQGKTTRQEQDHKRKYGAVENWLSKAQLDVPVATFLLYSLIWAAAGAAFLWFATGGYTIMPIVGGVGGVFLYSQYLISRRDDHSVRYEESIADFGDRLAIAASIKGTLEPSLKECIKILPDIIKPDVEEVVRDIEGGTPTLDALERLREKRRYAMMETLIESIRLWRIKASNVPLSKILAPVSTSLRRQAFIRQQETDKLGRVRNSLYVAVFGPPVIIFIFRVLNPQLSRYFETFEGEMLLFLSASISLALYYQGTRWLAAHRETVKFES